MIRPLYETSADLAAERGVARRLEKSWGCRMIKLPKNCPLDYVVESDGKARCICEVKVRSYTWARIEELGGYMLSFAKWEAARTLNAITLLPFMLAVSCVDDDLRWCVFEEFPAAMPIGVGGRTDRGDPQDIEPVIFLDCAKFTTL